MELLIHQKQLILTLDNRILESQKELVENHQLGSTLHYYKIDTGFLILIPKKKHFFFKFSTIYWAPEWKTLVSLNLVIIIVTQYLKIRWMNQK